MSDRMRWERVQALFHESLARAPEARDLYLAESCLGDADLEAEVRGLLAAHEADDLIAPLDEASDARKLFGLDSDRVGPYRILRPLGRGGMGVVFLATREEHDVSQTVALKLLRLDFADPKLVERFRSERRILARLEHPGIARLITVGATTGGQPYFAMEFVEGTDLLTYCRHKRCTVKDRLELFLEVCDAVEYAHQQLVVHRDLKPGNILVTEQGRPKLLDFGIAKLLDADEADSGFTRTGAWFTPEYASPEQLRREPVTTLSDVYALGVVLYELLAGARPFDFRSLSPAAIEEKVTSALPERPSSRVNDPRISKLIRGDLDTIVLKALSPEPGRRYASVRDLDADIRRYLARQPLAARPDSWSYRTSKFVQRHRLGVAAAAVMVLSLVGGLAAVSWQAAVAARARDRAELALEESRSVSDFLAQLFQAADPTRAAGDTGAARAILRQGVAEVERLTGQPLVQARMLDALGMVFVNMGEYERAHGFITRALSMRRRELDSLHPDIAESLQHAGRVLRALSRYNESERAYLDALRLVRISGRSRTPMAAELLRDLGFLMPYLGRDEDAARYYQDALSLERELHGDRHPAVAASLLRVAAVHRRRGEYAPAESVLRDAVMRHRRDIGPRDPLTGTALFHLADIIAQRGGDSAEAERLYREGIEIHRAGGGAGIGAVHGLGALANLLSERGAHAEAEALLRESLQLNQSVFGQGGPAVAGSVDALAAELGRQARFDEALRLKRRGLELWRDAVGPEHSAVASSMQGLASMLIESGGYAEAESVLVAVIAMRIRLHGPTSAVVAVAQSLLGELLYRERRLAEADTVLHQALEILRTQQSDEHTDMRQLYHRLASVSEALGQHEAARRYLALAGRG